MEEQNFLVKGSVILAWCAKNPKVKLFWTDFDDNRFDLEKKDIDLQRYYEFDLENGAAEVTLYDFVDTLADLEDWL